MDKWDPSQHPLFVVDPIFLNIWTFFLKMNFMGFPWDLGFWEFHDIK